MAKQIYLLPETISLSTTTISYRKGKYLKDTLIKAWTVKGFDIILLRTAGVVQARQHLTRKLQSLSIDPKIGL